MRIVDILAVGRERTEEEKRRRHLYGDKGAKFSQGKRMCLLGGNRLRDYDGNKRQFSMRDIRVIQVGQLLKRHSQAYTLYDADGLCPTLSSGQKRYGGLPTWIIIYDTESITDRKHR